MICRAVLSAALLVVASTACAPPNESAAKRRHRAWQDSVTAVHYARFGRPPQFMRGLPDSILAGPVALRVAAYEALLPGPYLGAVDPPAGQVPADYRPWLQAEFLSHEGQYRHFVPMDEALLNGLLATGRFRDACGGGRPSPCPTTGATVYVFSALYRVGPGVLRVFLAQRDNSYADEYMYRLEQRGATWRVADQALIMIT